MPADRSADLNEIFDLDRSKLVGKLVDQIGQCLHDIRVAQDDLKEVVASCREAQFSRRDINAMKKIAKLRLEDKRNAAREELEALERVGKAVGFDLFDWAEVRDQPPAAA